MITAGKIQRRGSLGKDSAPTPDALSPGAVNWSDVRGFNYQPGFGATGAEIWIGKFDANAAREELEAAKRLFPGMNAIRLWLAPEAYRLAPGRFMENVALVLGICSSLKLQAILVLFNNWHGAPDFGGAPEGVAEDPGQDTKYLPYLNAALGRWGNDNAVLAWDLCNEPILGSDHSLIPWLKRTYAAAKRAGARQPFGVSVVTMAQLEAVEECSDLLMIHPYSKFVPAGMLAGMKAFAAKRGKPLLATECCWGSLDNAERVELVKRDLDALKAAGIGFFAHALCESPVADLHRPDLGPVGEPGYMAFINRDRALREGHGIFNDYCAGLFQAEDFDLAVAWLEEAARRVIRASARRTPAGVNAFPPQAGCGYEAFWLRDYSYMLETCPDAFADGELVAACRLFVGAIGKEDGAGVDCVKFDGEPVYKPGYGSMGSKPVADGGQFTVNVAWSTWKQTGDDALLAELASPLLRTMKAVPVNPDTGLVHISAAPGEDRRPYGFTDTVRQSGDILFCSLLYIQAARRLEEMLKFLGRDSDAAVWRDAAARAGESVNSVLWDEPSGLYLAATGRCCQSDIWGSAFAVWLEVAPPDRALRVSGYFKDHCLEICQRGQIRHLPGGIYWEDACKRDTYQNGAYWATPAGWFVNALALTDRILAKATVVDLVNDFRTRGVCEWVFGDTVHLPGYVVSAALPLQGIRELTGRARPVPQEPRLIS